MKFNKYDVVKLKDTPFIFEIVEVYNHLITLTRDGCKSEFKVKEKELILICKCENREDLKNDYK